MRRTVSVLAATALAATTGVAVAASAPASAAPVTADSHLIQTSPYVALGDSYSSAAGVAPFVPGSPATCSRSLLNYAHDIAAKTNPASFTDVTCSGAKTTNFYSSQADAVAPQLDAVTKDTRLVTMTIGGNDGNVFVKSFFGCSSISSSDVLGNPCQKKYGSSFVDTIRNETYPHLVTALTRVKQKAPNATVVILGYPWILPATGDLACYPSMPISMGDVPWLNRQQETLNNVVSRAARQTGAVFVDMSFVSMGHDACQPAGRRWIEPAVGPVNAYPVHPNATGEAAMARQTVRTLGL